MFKGPAQSLAHGGEYTADILASDQAGRGRATQERTARVPHTYTEQFGVGPFGDLDDGQDDDEGPTRERAGAHSLVVGDRRPPDRDKAGYMLGTPMSQLLLVTLWFHSRLFGPSWTSRSIRPRGDEG